MGVAAREYVRDQFSLRALKDQLDDIVKKLVNK
jgi:hypothetical protein